MTSYNTKKQIASEIQDLILTSHDVATIEIKESEIKAIFHDGSAWKWVKVGDDEFAFSLVYSR